VARGTIVSEELDGAIGALAARQEGHVTRAQLLAVGLGRSGIEYRVAIGRLIRVHAGVYAVGHRPSTPVAQARGAVLACGAGAVLSHDSAAALWRMGARWQWPIEVTVPSGHRRRGIRVHRSTILTPQDVRVHLGIRVTSPARTALDIAARLSDRTLRRAVNDARLAGYLQPSELDEVLVRCPRHPGAKRLRHFVQTPAGPTRSAFEDAFLAFTRRFGLPRPDINQCPRGRLRG
jgi:hypothetical protein